MAFEQLQKWTDEECLRRLSDSLRPFSMINMVFRSVDQDGYVNLSLFAKHKDARDDSLYDITYLVARVLGRKVEHYDIAGHEVIVIKYDPNYRLIDNLAVITEHKFYYSEAL